MAAAGGVEGSSFTAGSILMVRSGPLFTSPEASSKMTKNLRTWPGWVQRQRRPLGMMKLSPALMETVRSSSTITTSPSSTVMNSFTG